MFSSDCVWIEVDLAGLSAFPLALSWVERIDAGSPAPPAWEGAPAAMSSTVAEDVVAFRAVQG